MPREAPPSLSFSLPREREAELAREAGWPAPVGAEWAWGGASGEGARVCVLDSGVESGHPRVGEVDRAVAVVAGEDGYATVVADEDGDVFGHGTACAGIIRSLAPRCELTSVRVLGPSNRGQGALLLAGLEWAIREGHDVINMSLSTAKPELLDPLRRLVDRAYFRRALVVASAHNMEVQSYPWRFSSVVSVGSSEGRDPFRFHYNPEPPVEFFAPGLDLEVAWHGGGVVRSSGNSFATAHISGICALILSKHPGLTPFELKSVLRLTAASTTWGEG